MTVFKTSACVLVLTLSGCGGFDLQQKTAVNHLSVNPLNSKTKSTDFDQGNAVLSAEKLREYCKACHAVGSMRFIWNESDEELWAYIFTNKAPNRNRLWAESIYEVLNWPSSVPPASFPVMDPPNSRDWMPKGSKRPAFAGDAVNGTPVRQTILDSLKIGLARKP